MPQLFSNEEYADIHFIYGLCDGNAREAVREYQRRFPNRRIPAYQVFINTHNQFRQLGLRKVNENRNQGPRNLRGRRRVNQILRLFDNDRSLSSRRASRQLEISRSTILRVLHRDHRHAYHLQPVQNLLPGDAQKRIHFCRWLLNRTDENPGFIGKVLWTDEASFSRRGVFNHHNMHVWANENPHEIRCRSYQHEFSVNIWLGVIGGHPCGPHVLPQRLNCESFLNFLEQNLLDLLEHIPLAIRHQSWFQMDGAPAHSSRIIRDWMMTNYQNRWIGRLLNEPRHVEGPVEWPPRSPDINPLDYFVWGRLKNEVYSVPIRDRDQLLRRVTDACNNLRQNQNEVLTGINSIIRRCQKCIEVGGEHFEQFL